MTDAELVVFLQRALPRLRLRWAGFRKVRGQVHKRLARRLHELRLSDLEAYEAFLDDHDDEWRRLERICRITISRFYRDGGVWDWLRESVLPQLASGSILRCWSAGCASGEEPYTIALVWWHDLRRRDPRSRLTVLATETDPRLLERAREAIYPASSLEDLPAAWREASFEPVEGRFRLRTPPRQPVELQRQDLRRELPDREFDVVLCRNLAFTYFEEGLQAEILDELIARLAPGGILVLGAHERLPRPEPGLETPRAGIPVYRRTR